MNEPHLAVPPGDAPPSQDDAVVIERSWDEPERFGAVFDAHYAEIHRYVHGTAAFSWSDSSSSRVTQAANPAVESTASDGSSPKPSSWTPGPHSACASSQAACRRAVGAISSGIPHCIYPAAIVW